MSSRVRQVTYKHFQSALARWPKDVLRPETQLQDVLSRRLEKNAALKSSGTASDRADLQQINALVSLLEDRYKTKYNILGMLMEPRSNPTHYADLLTELEEAPKRNWFSRVAKRLGGMIRLS